jgi:hypothetical protein
LIGADVEGTHRELSLHSEEVPEERKAQFRIGVNLGDAIFIRDRLALAKYAGVQLDMAIRGRGKNTVSTRQLSMPGEIRHRLLSSNARR